MNHPEDHFSVCKSGFGVVHRHNIVCDVFAFSAFRLAGLSVQRDASPLFPGTNVRLARRGGATIHTALRRPPGYAYRV